MFGMIGFEDLLIRCLIGVYPHERLVEQEILLDLQTEVDFSLVAQTDDLSHAVSYLALADFCTEFAKEKKAQMLETLATDMLIKLTEQFKLSWVKVVIRKPSAIPTSSFAYVELEMGSKKGNA